MPEEKEEKKKKKKTKEEKTESSSPSDGKKKKSSSSRSKSPLKETEGDKESKEKKKKKKSRSKSPVIDVDDGNDKKADDGSKVENDKATSVKKKADSKNKQELKSDESEDELKPIPPPNNPPMEKIRLIIKQPNLERLRMTGVDPANTTIRMVREFIDKSYYKGNKIPRAEQRKLLYGMKAVFDQTGDYNVDDAKTLADHNITQDESVIQLSYMHVHVVSPSDKKAMMINNIDPMNDVLFEMRKLALNDGYPIEKLRVLHKEANNRVITKSFNQATFFECGVKHLDTLILEWPKIVIRIKIPIFGEEEEISTDEANKVEGEEIIEENGRHYKLINLLTQTELDKVKIIHDFIQKRTGIPMEQQTLTSLPAEAASTAKNKPKKARKQQKLKDANKVIADYKIEENDIIELKPMTLKVNFIGGAEGPKQTTLEYVYPNDPVEFIKDAIEKGKGEADGIPSIPKTNLTARRTKDKKELKRNRQSLMDAEISDGDEVDVEKTKITIKVQLPESKFSEGGEKRGGKIIEIGVNPKLDDIETLKDLLADATGLPKEFIPPLIYNDESMEDDDKAKTKKLNDFGIAEFDVITVEPMKLNVNIPGGEGDQTSCIIDGVDPFNDTVDDIKKRLGPDDLNILPVEKQRLIFLDADLDEGSDGDGDGGLPPARRKLFQCNIKHMDTIDLEKSKIDIKIKQPNGEFLELKDVDPRKDTLESATSDFLSENYYKGQDKDGTIPQSQKRPLKHEGKVMNDNSLSLRDYGITDDGKVIEMEPMKVTVIIRPNETKVLDNVDPINDKIQDVKLLAVTEDTPAEKLILLHKEPSKMSEIEDADDKQSFYQNGIKDGDTLEIQRKPVTIKVKLPKGSRIKEKETDNDDGDKGDGGNGNKNNVKVIDQGDDGEAPILVITVDPDKDDFDQIRKQIYDYAGFPIDSQKLNKIVKESSDDHQVDDNESKVRLDVPGDTKLSNPELGIVDDCTIELEPMSIEIKTDTGKVIPLQVLPTDTIGDIKKMLAKDKINIPHNKQRLVATDGREIGGDDEDEENDDNIGSDKSTLIEAGIKDGDTIGVEKSKISLTVKMPHGMDDVEVIIDPKKGKVDQIRQFIFDATGLPKEYQQRLKFGDEFLDDGFKENDDKGDDGGNGDGGGGDGGGNGGGDGDGNGDGDGKGNGDDNGNGNDDGDDGNADAEKKKTKRNLASFNLKEFDSIYLEPVRIFIMRIPEVEKFVIEGVDPMKETLQDLKKRVALLTNLSPFKQRLLNSKTNEEYLGNKDSTEKLHEYGIKDGDLINLERAKINLRIILPSLDELDLTVDPRKDDLQKVKDFIFNKYYKKRKVPKEDLMPLLAGRKQLNDEPGETKLIEYGIMTDGDKVSLKPCYLTIATPRKVIYCPNADPFRDNLEVITNFVKHVGENVDGCYIEFEGQKMTDYESVLYDLKIIDGSKLLFAK